MNPENITLSERRQIQKTAYCMIPFIESVQSRRIHRDRKQMSVSQGPEGREAWEGLLNREGVSFWHDKKDLKFDRDGGCTTPNE